MKFIIERTSIYCDDNKSPCERAYKGTAKNKTTNQYDKVWYIDIRSLKDLIEFQNEIGQELIIKDDYRHGNKYKVIEIYDDYRE